MKKRLAMKKQKQSAERQLDQIKKIYLSRNDPAIVSMLIGTVLFPQEAVSFIENRMMGVQHEPTR